MLALMLAFFFGAGVVEKYKPAYGHETGFVVLVGIIFSAIFWFTKGIEDVDTFKFSETIFFDFLLPPIIFNSGYNMRRKKFFQNLGNVGIFGLGVTFMCFIMYSLITNIFISNEIFTYGSYYNPGWSVNETGNYTNDFPQKGEPFRPVKLDFLPLLLFTSLLCSSDVVAAVSIVNYHEQPKLYSCIFGEGVLNDIVSIILFNTVNSLQGESFEWYSTFIIVG
jgi:NhaP-type Na+/H+ or K+/H+ antiporter